MKNYNLHLVRCGRTEMDEKKLLGSGDKKTELSTEGIRELIALREQYDYPAVGLVYCPPVTRCVQTAGIVWPDRGMIVVEGLQDRALGEFAGKTMEELSGREDFRAWLADSAKVTPPGGEPMEDFCRRALGCFAAVVEDMIKSETYDAGIITDGGTIMTALAALAFPRLPMEKWMCGCGKGFTCFVNPEIWQRDRMVEAAGIMPHGLASAI